MYERMYDPCMWMMILTKYWRRCMYCFHSWRKGSVNGIHVYVLYSFVEERSVNGIHVYVLYSFVEEGECEWYTYIYVVFVCIG